MMNEAKRLIVNSIHRGIVRFWVHPLEALVIPHLEKRPGPLSSLLTSLAAWCANAGRVAVLEMRLYVLRLVGPDWSISYIGSGKSVAELCHILFPAPPQVIELPRACLWQAPTLVREFAQQGELVVCELNQILHVLPKGADVSFVVPAWVGQVLEGIDRPIQEILADMNQTMRRYIRRLETQGYSYVFTQVPEDFEMFFHRMYMPYIQSRHGRRALMRDYHFLNTCFTKYGGLILVKQGQDPVCGMLCALRDGTCEALEMGVLDGRFDLVKQGANVALWWFMLDWARSHGARRFHLGTSPAQTANGTFNFKRQWGARVYADIREYTRWSFYSKGLTAQLRERLNEQGLITQVAGQHYRLLLLGPDETVDQADLANTLDEVATCGLDGVVTLSTKGRRQVVPSKTLKLETAVSSQSHVRPFHS